MIDTNWPLRYKISSWRQLPECLSNNSRHLKIHLTDFFNNRHLRGFRISVDHDTMGTLFACILHARGDIVTDGYEFEKCELSTEEILRELKKFGFLITYHPNQNLPSAQLEYLISLRGLRYDKIRILNVWDLSSAGIKEYKTYIVAFMSDPHGDWLNNGYCPSLKEFSKALIDGTACNLTEVSKTRCFRWDWLNFVANIDDIIKENADDMIRIGGDDDE